MTSRINARISDELAQKLAKLRRRTGRTTTEILSASIDAYYTQAMAEEVPAAALLGDFIGSGEADEGLSQDYKAVLEDELGRKAGPR